jgi:hypothetical protein
MEQIEIITASDSNNRSSRTKTPECVLQSMLLALNEGRIFSVVGEFDDQSMFTDHALDLEFTDRANLADFFQKSRELFPDAVVDVLSIRESGDQAVAEWKLIATQSVRCGYMPCRFRISLSGVTIACILNGKIVRWSDYYDQITSRRSGLAAHFKEWIEL